MTQKQLEAYLAMYRALGAALEELENPGSPSIVLQIEAARKLARQVAPVEL